MNAASMVESAWVDDPITVERVRVQTTSKTRALAPERPKARKRKERRKRAIDEAPSVVAHIQKVIRRLAVERQVATPPGPPGRPSR